MQRYALALFATCSLALFALSVLSYALRAELGRDFSVPNGPSRVYRSKSFDVAQGVLWYMDMSSAVGTDEQLTRRRYNVPFFYAVRLGLASVDTLRRNLFSLGRFTVIGPQRDGTTVRYTYTRCPVWPLALAAGAVGALSIHRLRPKRDRSRRAGFPIVPGQCPPGGLP